MAKSVVRKRRFPKDRTTLTKSRTKKVTVGMELVYPFSCSSRTHTDIALLDNKSDINRRIELSLRSRAGTKKCDGRKDEKTDGRKDGQKDGRISSRTNAFRSTQTPTHQNTNSEGRTGGRTKRQETNSMKDGTTKGRTDERTDKRT
ncbi:hypothetical protein DPMN_189434 [Dreissena polymorpha]|uniref:Uncharacterized protein n=1 Tax=Dreissena polymorpha TaxID=45954 RepID=A0A9D4DT59_DREPO|nr:hypothetical protein DPMN_189434 [Dreissena polymorpha]